MSDDSASEASVEPESDLHQLKPPSPPTEEVLEIQRRLADEHQRADDAARAAARFEDAIHRQQVQERIQRGYSPEDAGNVRRVFSADEFNRRYQRLMRLRVDRLLIELLGLDDYADEIMYCCIQEQLGPQSTNGTAKKAIVVTGDAAPPPAPEPEREAYYGDRYGQFDHYLRRRARERFQK